MTTKILITGENSYIGTSFYKYCNENGLNFVIETISVRGEEWKSKDFSNYDVVLNVAGIAHRKETKENRNLYFEVNRNLAIDIATKAREENVGQYIYLSTMNVYGKTTGTITKETLEKKKNAYGESKLQAENQLLEKNSENFFVSIVRPPMVYGPNCVGNYTTLSKFAKRTKFFANYTNHRSMIFIDTLSLFISKLIIYKKDGIFYPQNSEYVNVKKMIEQIARYNNNTITFTSFFNPFINLMNLNLFKKIFGNLIYEKNMSLLYDDDGAKIEYQVIDFEKSIEMTELNEK